MAIYLPNTVEAVIGVFGILTAGGVFVIVNSSTKADKLAYILNNCRAAAELRLQPASLHHEHSGCAGDPPHS